MPHGTGFFIYTENMRNNVTAKLGTKLEAPVAPGTPFGMTDIFAADLAALLKAS